MNNTEVAPERVLAPSISQRLRGESARLQGFLASNRESIKLWGEGSGSDKPLEDGTQQGREDKGADPHKPMERPAGGRSGAADVVGAVGSPCDGGHDGGGHASDGYETASEGAVAGLTAAEWGALEAEAEALAAEWARPRHETRARGGWYIGAYIGVSLLYLLTLHACPFHLSAPHWGCRQPKIKARKQLSLDLAS